MIRSLGQQGALVGVGIQQHQRVRVTLITGDHEDVAIVLSNSGESEDLFSLVGSLQRLSVPIIAITGAIDSALARLASVVLDGRVREEAGPDTVAPTTSTSVALALGDALAIALMEEKGFRGEEFAKAFACTPGVVMIREPRCQIW